MQGLCLGLADWSAELRLLTGETVRRREKPTAAGAGRAEEQGKLD